MLFFGNEVFSAVWNAHRFSHENVNIFLE